MPSQENVQICDSTDNLNHILPYEDDLKSQSHQLLRLKNGSVKSPSSVLSNKGFPRTDNYSSSNGGNNGDSGSNDEQISAHELNSEMVCVYIY